MLESPQCPSPQGKHPWSNWFGDFLSTWSFLDFPLNLVLRCRRHSAVPWNPGPWIHPWGEFTEREIQWVHWLNLLQCRKRSLAVFWHWVLDQNRCGDLWKEMIWAALNAGKGLLLFLWHWSLEQKDAAYSAVVRVYWTGNGKVGWGRDLQPLRKELAFIFCLVHSDDITASPESAVQGVD